MLISNNRKTCLSYHQDRAQREVNSVHISKTPFTVNFKYGQYILILWWSHERGNKLALWKEF
jgi:hypothetical protein